MVSIKRSLPRQRLKRSPLVHVLAQLKYTPVFDTADKIPAVQTQLAALGFPRFQASRIQSVVLTGGEAPKVDVNDRWDFLDRERRVGVVLTRDFVLLQTNRYDDFEAFGTTFRDVASIVGDVVGPSFVDRMGLRYVDLVRPEESETIDQYLQPGLIGYRQPDGPGRVFRAALSHTETRGITSVGQLSIRCFQRNDGAYLPPDLWPPVLRYDIKAAPPEILTILDFDHFTSDGCEYEVDPILTALGALHDAVDRAFRGAVSEYAFRRWEREG